MPDFAIRESGEALLLEALERADPEELGRLLQILQARFAAIGKKTWLVDKIADRLPAYALSRCEPDAVRFLDALRKKA